MNKYKKYSFILVTLIIGILKYTKIAPNIILNDYSENEIIKFLAKNLFENEITVSSEKIEVLDYKIIDNLLYIYPMNDKVILPLDGMIINRTKNKITLSNTYYNLNIYLIDSNYYLYQYYKNNAVLGTCKDYYVIESDDYTNITRHFTLYNEKI